MEEHVESVLSANDTEICDMSTNKGNTFKKRKVQNSLTVNCFRLGLDLPNLLKMIKASKSPR